ncbi:hypothetical protein GCM10009780_49230 [Actinomadura alba]
MRPGQKRGGPSWGVQYAMPGILPIHPPPPALPLRDHADIRGAAGAIGPARGRAAYRTPPAAWRQEAAGSP